MYSKIASILDAHFDNNWFLDSGSLLGVVRDGKFLASDKGIDISAVILENYDSVNISDSVDEIEKLGFIVSRYKWGCNCYKYCFVPNKRTGFDYAFDLHLFKKKGDTYYCPQISFIKAKNSGLFASFRSIRKGNPISGNGWKQGIASIYRNQFRYFNQPMQMKKIYEKGIGDTYFWYIPQELLRETEFGEYGLRKLSNCSDYLHFRYGDWHIPVGDWVTLRDDGGIKKCTFSDINELMFSEIIMK